MPFGVDSTHSLINIGAPKRLKPLSVDISLSHNPTTKVVGPTRPRSQ